MAAALEIGLILDNVFKYLSPQTDNTTLKSCILVNHVWFRHASEVLWYRPPPAHLASISTARRQLYASKVRVLNFNGGDGQFHPLFESLTFPRLAELRVDSITLAEPVVLSQYLQLRLRTFELYGGVIEYESLLEGLKTRCSGLQYLLIDNPRGSMPSFSTEDLLDLLKHLRNAESIVLMHGWDDIVEEQVLVHLAGRPNLSRLSLCVPWVRRYLEGMRAISNPFRRLSSLTVHVHSGDILLLLTKTRSVTNLDIMVEGNSQHDPFSTISMFRGLTSLRITMNQVNQPFKIEAQELLFLRNLTRLKALQIGSDGLLGYPDALTITADDLKQLLNPLHDLRIFSFEAQCSLPADWLGYLANHKTHLRNVKLPTSVFSVHDIPAEFESSSQLETLIVGDLNLELSAPTSVARAQDTVKALLRLFPKLNYLELLSDSQEAEDIQEQFDFLAGVGLAMP